MRQIVRMETKTIVIDAGTYELLRSKRRGPRENFSKVIRRLVQECPALTAGELEEAMKPFEGKGAGPRRVKRRAAA